MTLMLIEHKSDVLLYDHVDAFLRDQDIKDTTKQSYKKGIQHFENYLESRDITTATREDILNFKRHLQNTFSNAGTASTYLVGVRRFFDWLECTYGCRNPTRGIKGFKVVQGFKKDTLSIDQVINLLKTIDQSTLEGKRNFAMLNLMIRTGIRRVEVIRADVQDIIQCGGKYTLQIHGKGRDAKDEIVVLTETTMCALWDYLSARNAKDGEPLFTSVSDQNYGSRLSSTSISMIVKNALIDINLNNARFTAHSLRHTAITLALKHGATLQEAQALGRHANINTTMVYAHNLDRVANAAEDKIEEVLSRHGL